MLGDSGGKGISRALKSMFVVFSLILWFGFILPTQTVHAADPVSFTFLGTHPDAAAQSTAAGKIIQKLKVFNNKLYIGYGDYNANTGPMKINPYDLNTNAFTGSLLTFNSEQMSQFRILGNKLYAPSIDPTCGNWCLGGYASGEPWAVRSPVNVVHVYDMATLDGTDLWMAGASNVGARMWRSTDGGTVWNTVQEDTSASPSGYERYYWVAQIKGKIYFQAGNTVPATPMRIFDGTTWTTGSTDTFSLPESKVEVFKDKIIANNFNYLQTFDGTNMAFVPYYAAGYWDISPSGDYLYAVTSNYKLVRTSNLTSWEVLGDAPTGSRSVTVYNGYVYVGTADSKIYRALLPVEAVATATASSTTTTLTTKSSATTNKAAYVATPELPAADEKVTPTTETPITVTAPSTKTKSTTELTRSSKYKFVWYVGLGGLVFFLAYGAFLAFRP